MPGIRRKVAEKKRLDLLLMERGLAETEAQARATIMAGEVMVNQEIIDKVGTLVSVSSTLTVKDANLFVSRGGVKLAKALAQFNIDLTGRVVLDVGASTGGFTDCCLQAGASLVYAVDVGYGQLAWGLRSNPAVVNFERTNIRFLSREKLNHGLPDFACIDVAFISLRLVLPVVAQLLIDPAELVMLIKPQFEASRDQVGKKGVVREAKVHIQVLETVLAEAGRLGLALWNLDFSPVQGPQGNIEYLAHGFFGLAPASSPLTPEQVVEAAHRHFA